MQIVYVIEPRVAGTFEERQQQAEEIHREVTRFIHRYFSETPRSKPKQHRFLRREYAERAMEAMLLAKPHLQGKVRVSEMGLGWTI